MSGQIAQRLIEHGGTNMSTKLSCRFTGLVVGLATLFLCISPASGAFMDLGTSGWEYDAPADVTLAAPTTSGSTTSFTLQKVGWGDETVEILFRTKANVMQIEHFFMLNFDITTSKEWGGFRVQLIDRYDAVGPPPPGASSTEIQHPIWAHIHPNHNVGGGPFYDPFTTRNPSTSRGVEVMTLSDGVVPEGAVWLGSRFRLHDVSTTGYADPPAAGVMEYRLLLTPIPTPEPSSLTLLLGCATIIVGLRPRMAR
jgi:hypothetical protein